MTSPADDVAVIIPLHDGAAWIGEALGSVRAQQHPAAEVVVVDDGSRDDGPQIARAWGARVLRNPRRGSTSARNLGLAATDAALVAFLDQDDVWHAAHLRRGVEALRRHPGAASALAAVHLFQETLDPAALGGPVEPPDEPDLWRCFPFRFHIDGPSAVLLRRRPLEAAGGWDERFTGVADRNLWLRIATRGPSVWTGLRSVGKRCHDRSMTARRLDWFAESLDLHLDSMRAALDDRITQGCDPADVERLEARLAILALANALMKSVRAGTGAERADAARKLDAALAGHAPALIAEVLLTSAGLLATPGPGPEFRRSRTAVLRDLHRRWPRDAAATRSELAQLIEALP